MHKITMTDELKTKMIQLYNEGLMDTEIAKCLNISDSVVYYWRKKLNLKTKFTYKQINKIDNNLFEKLFYKGLNDREIAEQLHMSPSGIYSHRMRHGYIRKNYSESSSKKLTQFQKEVLLGTVMGDSSLHFTQGSKHAFGSCSHGIKQQSYCQYKCEIFNSIGAKGKYSKRKTMDKRTGIYYENYTFRVPANPELDIWYQSFYKNGKKVIPFNLFEYFTPISLAYLFMDDGSKTQHSYYIATNCFTREELEQFSQFLYKTFNIETTIQKNNILYIKTKSASLFEHLISPYIHKSMKYKLHRTVS